jgi:hypothetical protein
MDEDFDDRTCTSGTVLESDSSESTNLSFLLEEDSGEGEAAGVGEGSANSLGDGERQRLLFSGKAQGGTPEYSACFASLPRHTPDDRALAPREVDRQGVAREKENLEVYFVNGLQSAPASSTGPGAAELLLEGKKAGATPRALLMSASFSSLPRHTPTDDGALSAPQGVYRQSAKDLATMQSLTGPGGSQEEIAGVPAEQQPVAGALLPLPLTPQPVSSHR